jgi:hypothetical protein
MPNIEQQAPRDHIPQAGYYPPHERVIKLERMADGITELVAHLDAGTFRLLELICEFDQKEGWAGPGVQSCAHWLNWKCGMSMGPARKRQFPSGTVNKWIMEWLLICFCSVSRCSTCGTS